MARNLFGFWQKWSTSNCLRELRCRAGGKICATSALENASTTYSLTGQLEYNVSNEDNKHWLCQMFVGYYCEGCSAAPLTQYKNKEIE